ncbi:hypothetical protein LZG74_25320 [Dyadobacter sp. CY327]|uniref:hypothetical protein n=1 Tax=Dyadobacter sp. CY327 TaxID=2907301 RepID=UPI001F2C25D9|nr:hypothetical protein [Dyadobacter sp. CY327]MCE7073656.1 hypothetical protein [Dyadobacter sp. CY327]
MFLTLLGFIRNKIWLAFLLCIAPIIIYIWVFQSIALNVNYVAFDDILVFGIIPEFERATWPERWQLLTTLFPEHRLVFSRSVILLFYDIFGRVNLVWLMIVANICWGLCAFIFYKAFQKLHLSIWYFVPVMWLWFNIQSYENIFWGVSSLCNFGVILFVLSALYFAAYHPKRVFVSLIFAVAATFTYGNGLMVFPVIALMFLITGRRNQFFTTVLFTAFVALIYFLDFTPITQNLSFSDPQQVKEGFFGLFGFIGSIATVSAYSIPLSAMYIASAFGMLLVIAFIFLYQKQILPLWHAAWLKSKYTNRTAIFALAILIFIGITTLALTYKRIPTDTFAGMFKGRYRMYSTMCCIALYFAFLSLKSHHTRLRLSPVFLISAIVLNMVILHGNFAEAVNYRRSAVTQEFNARYNADWLGIRMFSMDQKHFEKIRAYYNSTDPLAEGWNPKADLAGMACDSIYTPDLITQSGDYLAINFEQDFFKPVKDYTDGAYVILKSKDHVYTTPPNQSAVPLRTTIRRGMYFNKGAFANFHRATIEPGNYSIFLMIRKNGQNKIYCTGKTWNEID